MRQVKLKQTDELSKIVLAVIGDQLEGNDVTYQCDLIRHALINEISKSIGQGDIFLHNFKSPLGLITFAMSLPIFNCPSDCGKWCRNKETGTGDMFKGPCIRCRHRLIAVAVTILQGSYAPLVEDHRLLVIDPIKYLKKYYTEINTATLVFIIGYLMGDHNLSGPQTNDWVRNILKIPADLSLSMFSSDLSVSVDKEVFTTWFTTMFPGMLLVNLRGGTFSG